jgi:hypothetical protein
VSGASERAGPRADGRDRTGDIRFTRAVLYQLSYVGVVSHRTAETAHGADAPAPEVDSGGVLRAVRVVLAAQVAVAPVEQLEHGRYV